MIKHPEIKFEKVPRHVAIIMDGNGRWAKARGLSRVKGHEAGAENVRRILKASRRWGVKYVTLYAFSVENWVRPNLEIKALMALLEHFLKKEEAEFHESKLRLRVTGRIDDLPGSAQREIARVMKATEKYDEGQLVLALSYGGRSEIVDATKKIAEKVKRGELKAGDIDEKCFGGCLYNPDIPDPDLMIRTSGEIRISNFLLWELSYSELYFTDVMWPDFNDDEYAKAIHEYGKRQRRFGDVK